MTLPVTRDAVVAWVDARAGRKLGPAEQADLLAVLPEPAAATLVEDFARDFAVDLQDHDPDLHRIEADGLLRIGWPFPALPPQGVRVPVSVSLLVAAGQAGTWPLQPPAPRRSADLSWLNLPILALGLPALTLALLALVRAIF